MPAALKKARPSIKKVPLDEVVDYRVDFKVRRPLFPSEDPREYVMDIEGEITWWEGEPAVAPEPVGRIQAMVIQSGRATNHREDLVEVCDSSQTTLDVYALLFDREGMLNDTIVDGMERDGILILDRVEILPKHRGRRVGQLAVLRTLEDFGAGMAAIVLKPFPLQTETNPPSRRSAEEQEYRRKYALDDFEPDHKKARDRLRRYWGELGFTRIKGSDWYVLDPAYTHPSFDDFVVS